MSEEPDVAVRGDEGGAHLRRMRLLVMMMTASLFLLAIIALGAIAFKLLRGEDGGTAPPIPYEARVQLLPGETLADVTVDRGQAYLRVENRALGAARILVLDAASGELTGVVAVEPAR